MLRNLKKARALAAALGLPLLGMVMLAACGFSPWPDRDPVEVNGLPAGAPTWAFNEPRFVMPDDSVWIRVQDIKTGYACTQITSAEVELSPDHSEPGVAAYTTRIRALMPEVPSCPVQDERDTVLPWKVAAPAGVLLQWVNGSGVKGDRAWVVSGDRRHDSLLYLRETTGIIQVGTYTYRDSSLVGEAMLYADSLPPCTFLNRVLGRRSGDTVVVQVESIDIEADLFADNADHEYACRSELHTDSMAVVFGL